MKTKRHSVEVMQGSRKDKLFYHQGVWNITISNVLNDYRKKRNLIKDNAQKSIFWKSKKITKKLSAREIGFSLYCCV